MQVQLTRLYTNCVSTSVRDRWGYITAASQSFLAFGLRLYCEGGCVSLTLGIPAYLITLSFLLLQLLQFNFNIRTVLDTHSPIELKAAVQLFYKYYLLFLRNHHNLLWLKICINYPPQKGKLKTILKSSQALSFIRNIIRRLVSKLW